MSDEKEIMLDERGLSESSGILTVYNFDPETGLYTGSSQEFLVQELGVPADSTMNVPPSEIAGQLRGFLTADGSRWPTIAAKRSIDPTHVMWTQL